MKGFLLSLASLVFAVLPLYAEEPAPAENGERLLMEQLSADDLEMLQMVELLDLLGDIDTLVRLNISPFCSPCSAVWFLRRHFWLIR